MPGLVITFGKMAGGGAIPRDDFGTLREDPWTVLVVVDDDDIFEENLNYKLNFNLNLRKTTDEVGCLNTLMNSLNEVISCTLLREN